MECDGCIHPCVLSEKDRVGAKPFVKWAGGKGQILNELLPRIDIRFQNYLEPFVGGGALFFALFESGTIPSYSNRGSGLCGTGVIDPKTYIPPTIAINDKNEELANAYKVIQSNVLDLIASLEKHVVTKEHFYEIRAQDPMRLSEVERASRFIFLNKTCYNGLWRVNKKGQFNVPYGRYKNPKIFDETNLLAVSCALRGVSILCEDFQEMAMSAQPGDFVYFDPPYHPLSESSSFTSYVDSGFDRKDHERLAHVVRDLTAAGVFCMVSNSDTEFTRRLYAGLRVEHVEARRSINSKKDGRGCVPELIVRNW
ncbi:MAG TPA: DNA adenine methylase [Bacillota bacterium]|nr:DNA adenine methylase [Bacillota bacterium]HRC53238.1 DNA adenine methylase [Bacillota bacterium]